MGFYYGQGGEPPKPEDDRPGWGETFVIIWVVFRALALPLALLFGAVFGVIAFIWLLTISGWLALGMIALGLGALGARAWWEWRHPPTIEDVKLP